MMPHHAQRPRSRARMSARTAGVNSTGARSIPPHLRSHALRTTACGAEGQVPVPAVPHATCRRVVDALEAEFVLGARARPVVLLGHVDHHDTRTTLTGSTATPQMPGRTPRVASNRRMNGR